MRSHDWFICFAGAAAVIIVMVAGSSSIKKDEDQYNIEYVTGNSLESLRKLKTDCEKALPRDQECVALYEFVPVKKEKSE